jgi:hypothetical protein
MAAQARVVPNDSNRVGRQAHVQFKTVAAARKRMIKCREGVLRKFAATASVSKQQHSPSVRPG